MEKKVELVNSNIVNHQLLSIELRLLDSREREIYQKFIDSEPSINQCPNCKDHVDVTADQATMVINNPLSRDMGLCLAYPKITCDKCGMSYTFNIAMDYTAYPSVVQFVKALITAAQNKQK